MYWNHQIPTEIRAIIWRLVKWLKLLWFWGLIVELSCVWRLSNDLILSDKWHFPSNVLFRVLNNQKLQLLWGGCDQMKLNWFVKCTDDSRLQHRVPVSPQAAQLGYIFCKFRNICTRKCLLRDPDCEHSTDIGEEEKGGWLNSSSKLWGLCSSAEL